jgi:hypothetical protein
MRQWLGGRRKNHPTSPRHDIASLFAQEKQKHVGADVFFPVYFSYEIKETFL